MSSYVHIDNKNKDILIIGEGPAQRLNNSTLTAKTKYPINFAQSRKRCVLSLYYNKLTKCVSLNNQNYEIQPTLINLHPKDYSQELHNYPFAIKLDRCV